MKNESEHGFTDINEKELERMVRAGKIYILNRKGHEITIIVKNLDDIHLFKDWERITTLQNGTCIMVKNLKILDG